MPLTTDKFDATRLETELEYYGSKFKVGYNPSSYTGNLIQESMGMGVYEYLPKILTDWEVLYGKKDEKAPEELRGKMVPLTEAALRGLPLPFLQYVNRAITELIVPNANTPTG